MLRTMVLGNTDRLSVRRFLERYRESYNITLQIGSPTGRLTPGRAIVTKESSNLV
jgi:hypothetical protein